MATARRYAAGRSSRRIAIVTAWLAFLSLLAVCSAPGLTNTAGATALPECTVWWWPTTPDQKRLPAATRQQLKFTVDEQLQQLMAPGAVVVAWTPEGTWCYTIGKAAIGWHWPLVRGEVFPIRSITKSFTVTLVLQLADEGMLSLDDHIDKYVPGIQAGDRITLRELAAMTSGLPDYTNQKFIDDFEKDTTKKFTTAQLLGYMRGDPMEFPPGTKAAYSNVNTLLLGLVVEKVTGKRFEQVLKEKITGPLHLYHTEFLTTVDYPQPHPVAYTLDKQTGKLEANPPLSLSVFSFAGGMVSTASDLRTWVSILASGKLLKPATQMERFDAAQPLSSGPEYDRYGLGIGEIDGWWGHTGDGFGITTAALADTRGTSGVVILLNSDNDHDGPAHIARQLIPILKKAG